MKRFLSTTIAAAILLFAGSANALTIYEQDFSTNLDGWYDYNSEMILVNSGAFGSEYALITENYSGWTGAFSGLGGYSSDWDGGFTTSLDIYLDPAWGLGSGFDYSSAVSNSSGGHKRDFIFHVTKDTSSNKLLVGGSNNSNFSSREDLENINHYEVDAAGWYTFRHVFYEENGILNVDLDLIQSGSTLFTETRTTAADTIDTVGGNRYGWITFMDVDGGLAIDNSILERNDPVPEPSTIILFAVGLLGASGLNRRLSLNK